MDKKKETEKLSSNKVFQVLSHLNPNERKRLLKFLNSPYFNQSKTLTQLCEFFYKHIEAGKKGFNKDSAWIFLFKGEKYDDISFRKYCSDLLNLVEKYLSKDFSGDYLNTDINLLASVVEKRIEPLYNSGLRAALQKTKEQAFNSSSYLDQFLVEKLAYKIYGYDDKAKNSRLNVEDMSKFLDLFYIIEKIKILCIIYSQKRIIDYNYDVDLSDQMVSMLDKFDLNSIPELAVYYYALHILKDEENEVHFYNLKRTLEEYGAFMSQKDAIELFESAMNYCIGRLNKGNVKFLEEYFALVEIALNKKIFIINNEITIWRYNNFVAAALRLGKVEWAEKFIEKNKEFLPADSRENTYTFNLARVYRYQQKYDKVLGLLRNVEYEDIGYNLISKAVLIITYYELDETEALDSFVESFRVFLNRHKNIPAARRKSYLNLIKYVRRLTRLLPGDTPGIEKLRQEIIREKASTVNHEWLLEKLTELE